jgi:hypothetical protein
MKGYSNVVEAVVLSTLSGNCGESAHHADILSLVVDWGKYTVS